MLQILLLKKSARVSSSLLRPKTLISKRDFGYGIRLCMSKVKPLTQVQIRRVSEAKPANNDLRRRYFRDLIVTIEKLHKTKLSEYTDASSKTSNVTRGQNDFSVYPSSWISSVDSFSRQLLKFSPDMSASGSGNMVAAKPVQITTNAPRPAIMADSSVENQIPTKKLSSGSKVMKKLQSADALKHETISAKNISHHEIKRMSSNVATDDRDLAIASTLDIFNDQDIIMLNSEKPASLFVIDEYNAVEDSFEHSDLHYDIVRSRSLPAETADPVAKNSKAIQKEMRKKRPVRILEDLENQGSFKEVVENINSLLKGSKQSMIEQARESETKAKEASYLAEVLSYVDLCIHTNALKNAQSLLTTGFLRGQHKKVVRGLRPVRDLQIYNRLMGAWAKQGNLEAIRKLFLQTEGLQLKPSFKSFAICLECIGRQNVSSHDVIINLLQDIKNAGFQLENIFVECSFVEEDKSFILKAIRQVQPKFCPNVRVIPRDYECPLLLDLNSDKKMVTNPYHGVLSSEQFMEKAVKQIKIEMMDEIVFDSVQPSPFLSASVLAARMRLGEEKEKWRATLKRAFLTNRQHMFTHCTQDSETGLLPYLKLWHADVYVDLMMQEIEMIGRHLVQYSPSCTLLNFHLGEKVFRKYVIESRIRSKYIDKSLYLKYIEKYNEDQICQNHRQMFMQVMSEMGMDNFMPSYSEKWPSSVLKGIGKFLYNVIMSEVKTVIPLKRASEDVKNAETRPKTEIPAFFTVYRMRNGIPTEEIMPHPFLVRLYSDANLTQLNFDPSELPSLVPPIPWCGANYGGNLLNTTELIRNVHFSKQQYKTVRNLPVQSLYPMFDGLNAVGACPWRVNKKVLDVVIEVFNKGGDMKIGIPEKVDIFAELPKATPMMSAEERLKLYQNNRDIARERKQMYSMWCTELYRLSIAQEYRDEVIWFPHSMDFRGRIYPTPPHFNHLGNDVGRSILMFAKGKPLGPGGLDWLKIHLVNLTGFKKRRPNRDRLEYANEIMPEVFDSADNPLTGNLWWQKSDEPWQTLACCVELANALRSPDPEKFVSYIPVHQDGSCNGLQHYAALGRDESGASSVNLKPFDEPQDVYSDVVDLVEKCRKSDSSQGVQIAQQLEGFVQRKVIKQTVMTTVYGVTRYGARLQIGGQLHHLEEFPKEFLFHATNYLTNKTFESLEEMFTSTKQIQDWFVCCSDIISRLHQKPVEWVTPLGWPIIQPYFKMTRITDKKLGSASYEKPVPYKQKNAFPPNFIHSLDSAHMMLTAIHCLRNGILFASVHDCFWTHASDVPEMNQICRQQFVGLHSQPILEDLAKYFVNKFGFTRESFSSEKGEKLKAMEAVNQVLNKLPTRGTFDVTKVMDSTYFFS